MILATTIAIDLSQRMCKFISILLKPVQIILEKIFMKMNPIFRGAEVTLSNLFFMEYQMTNFMGISKTQSIDEIRQFKDSVLSKT